ncbi:MAG: hypothetical protein COA97_04480 [Flavobacteriales bacterium]|nr:MAG: hypothetical protein COA97_04480 [Flavobacteriales bacterium]
MKRNYLYTVGVLLTIIVTIGACSKKDRDPKLIIHVQETDGIAADGARVHVWPGPNAGQSGTGSNIIDDELMDQVGITDAAGNVSFNFRYSAVLDVDVIYYKTYLDTLLNPITDTLYGNRVVKIESLRQSDETNEYNETVEVK